MLTALFKKKESFNCLMFIIVYSFIGILNGILYDVLMTFLQLTSTEIANSFSSFLGIATFISAGLMFAVTKVGYKKIMLFGSITAAFSLTLIIFSKGMFIKGFGILFLISGITMFEVIIAPFLSSFTNSSNRNIYFTAAFYTNVIGSLLGTFTGGPLIVSFFSAKLNISYEAAKILTENIASLSNVQRGVYIESHKKVLMLFILVLILSIIPILFIKETKQDYHSSEEKSKDKLNFKAVYSKYALLYLIYAVICKIAVSLIVPYVSIYLGTLGINRASVSIIMTAQYLAILVFMPFAPFFIKKFGQVNMLAWFCLVAIPFMFIIGNGGIQGLSTISIISTSLFFRSGLINATSPVFSSIPMELVEKKYRPAYSSIIFIAQGISQTITGFFAKNLLFKSNIGYGKAYFIAGALFALAQVFLLLNFSKLHSKSNKTAYENSTAEV